MHTRPIHSSPPARALRGVLAALVVALPRLATAQMIDDGIMMPRHEFRLTLDVARAAWSSYWEGTLKRTNDNIGTLTTSSTMVALSYGLTRDVSLYAQLPYVSTSASQGVLAGQQGRQDLTVGVKARLLQTPFTSRGRMDVVALAGGGTPTSNYTPDFLPMSIGLGAKRALVRGLLHYKDRTGFYAEAGAGYTWRSNVRLDRPAYYTNGTLVLSDQVAMPSVADWVATAGFNDGRLCLPISLIQQRTLGGGDIRRQDMPFVSNRMDFTKIQAMAMVTLPGNRVIASLGTSRVLQGRNVGQASMFMGGVTLVVGH